MSTGNIGSRVPPRLSEPFGWAEDGNSPASASADSSLDYTIAGEYDLVRVVVGETTGSESSQTALQMQVNGDSTSNYFFRATDTTTVGNNSQWRFARSGDPSSNPIFGEMTLLGRWNQEIACTADIGGAHNQDHMFHGRHSALTSPLDSFSLTWATGTLTTTVEVYGRSFG